MIGELIVLHKSPEALRSDWTEFLASSGEALKAIDREEALIKAALENDTEALAKVASDANDITFAKVKAADVKANHFGSVSLHTGRQLVKWLNAFNSGYDKLKRLEKRSARFHGGVR
jgi:hypothetical protein